MNAAARTRQVAAFFESFAPADVDRLDAWYAPDAAFKDPFNDVQGLEAIRRIYRHMFEQLDQPRFEVWRCTPGEAECWLAWRFRFGTGAKATLVNGATHLVFDGQGLIQVHRDYWDAAEELYEKAPVLGWLMRAIKSRLAAK